MKTVDMLINSSMNSLTEADRPWLEVLEAEQLESMLPPEVNEEDITLEEYVDAAPEGIKATLNSALSHRTEARKTLVANIMAHPANKFTEEVLNAKPCAELSTLSEMLAYKPEPPPAPTPAPTANAGMAVPSMMDYSGAAGGPAPTNNSAAASAPLAIPTINEWIKPH